MYRFKLTPVVSFLQTVVDYKAEATRISRKLEKQRRSCQNGARMLEGHDDAAAEEATRYYSRWGSYRDRGGWLTD